MKREEAIEILKNTLVYESNFAEAKQMAIEALAIEPSKSCCDKAPKNYDVDKCPYQRKNCIMQCLRSEDIKELPKEIINMKSVFNLSEDDISRQDAIDALERERSLVERPIVETRWFDLGLRKAQDVLSELPSADRPTAHWKDGKWCSNCGEGIPTDVYGGGVEKDEIRFCFSCGARMESNTE